jgi:hypothetical protein
VRRAALTLAIAVLASSSLASAQDESVSHRRLGVHWREGVPELVFSASDLASPTSVRERLQSGLAQTLVMRIYAYRESGEPIAMAARSCRVIYDPWEEIYRVQVQEARVDRVESFHDLDAVVRRCLVARRMPIGGAAEYRGLAGQSVYFAVLVELNPLSPETVHRLRRWLTRPAGGAVGQEAFFGSFVSLFVNRRIGSAERTLRFRSQLVRMAP